jgi:uncharacterized SAM-binding protein YcdF (DUF218 family)
MPEKRRKAQKHGPASWRSAVTLRMLISLIVAAGVCAFMIGVQGLNDRVFPADAALVFNCGAGAGALPPRLQAGAEAAFGLYYYGTVKKIVIGGAGKSGVEAVRDYFVAHGVRPEDLVFDPEGGDTRAVARFTALYAKEHGWERVIAVSQFFHLPRAVMALKHEGVPVVGSLSAGRFEGRDFLSLLREIPAYFAYWSEIKQR